MRILKLTIIFFSRFIVVVTQEMSRNIRNSCSKKNVEFNKSCGSSITVPIGMYPCDIDMRDYGAQYLHCDLKTFYLRQWGINPIAELFKQILTIFRWRTKISSYGYTIMPDFTRNYALI